MVEVVCYVKKGWIVGFVRGLCEDVVYICINYY